MQNRFVSRPYVLVSLVSLADSFRQGHIMWGVLEFEGVYALRHGFQTVSVFFRCGLLEALLREAHANLPFLKLAAASSEKTLADGRRR